MSSKRLRFLAVLTLIAALAASQWTWAQPDLSEIVSRLESRDIGDRIGAIRSLLRLDPPDEQVQPILEKLSEDPEPQVRVEALWAAYELLGAKSAELLENYYSDADRKVRESSVRAACRLWDRPRPKDLCRSAFDDPDFAMRSEVIDVLRENFPRDPDVAALMRKGLEDPSALVQRAAVFGVQAARDAKAVPLLARAAREASDSVAVPAAEAGLATIANPEAIRALISLLPKPETKPGEKQRPSDDVRAAAARALARIKAKEAIEPLRPLLTDPYVPVKLGAMEALLRMNDQASAPTITRLLADPEVRVRRYALRALRYINAVSAAPQVRKVMMEDKDEIVRQSAVTTYADLIGAEAVPDLMKLKQDPVSNVRLEVAGALGGIGQPAADALVEFITDPSPDVRALAINGLGQIGGKQQIPRLAAAAKDKDRRNMFVRAEVAEALGEIGAEEGIPALVELAADAEPTVREKAATSLGSIGGKKATQALEQLLKDPVPRVRNSARRALERSKS